jgi:hypothetical protein
LSLRNFACLLFLIGLLRHIFHYGLEMGALWELYGSSLGALWELSGSSLGALWELSGSSLGALWELVTVAGIFSLNICYILSRQLPLALISEGDAW